MKTPLLICSRRRSWRVFRFFGSILLILIVRSVTSISLNLGISFDLPLDTDSEDELRLRRDVEGALALCSTLGLDEIALSFAVLIIVALGTVENDGSLLFVGLRKS